MYLSDDRQLPLRADTMIGLTAAERAAVRLGWTEAYRFGWDGARSGRLAGIVRRMVTAITGIEGVTPLGNERLEALRRLGGLARRDDARLADATGRLAAMGCSRAWISDALAIARG